MNIILAIAIVALINKNVEESFISRNKDKEGSVIIIQGDIAGSATNDVIPLEVLPANKAIYESRGKTISQKAKNGHVKWIISSREDIIVRSKGSPGLILTNLIAEPGDSIYIHNTSGGLSFSGKGSEKFSLAHEISVIQRSHPEPSNKKYYEVDLLSDYLEWHRFISKQEHLINKVIDKYKSHISSSVLLNIRYNALADLETKRLLQFDQIFYKAEEQGLRTVDLCHIYDSTITNANSSWLMSIGDPVNFNVYYYPLIRSIYYRQNNFEGGKSLRLDKDRKAIFFKLGRLYLKGKIREEYLVHLLTEETLTEDGLCFKTNKILKDYYLSDAKDEYKRYVKNVESLFLSRKMKKGEKAPDLVLQDVHGKVFSTDQFRGKMVFLNFYEKDIIGILPQRIKQDTSIIFLNISNEENRSLWEIKIHNEKHSQNEFFLFAGVELEALKKKYNISSFPKYHLIDEKGRNVVSLDSSDIPSKSSDWEKLILEHFNQLNRDGAYVLSLNDSSYIYDVYKDTVQKVVYSRHYPISFRLITDSFGAFLNIILKPSYNVEPSEFDEPSKMFVLSDIEGNYQAFHKLLVAGEVIDKNNNWTFGKGHLIINGDVFDRGKQVTECLWLIYYLEDKARAAGGYVHFILGNHEIMNLNNKLAYTHAKYKRSAESLNIPYSELYGDNSELVKWMRTKNIMERVGKYLIVHGGVSQEINNLNLSIKEINEVARKYYSHISLAYASVEQPVSYLFKGETSPFWFRGYFKEPSATIIRTIDDTLKKFNVTSIITGHTIVSDMISSHYGGKIINTDTPHAKDKSEALLIVNSNCYIISAEGVRKHLPRN